jgi:hypothetical protein
MAKAGLTPSTDCPAARLAREAAATIVAQKAADEAGRAGGSEMLLERLEAIEDACTYERATSALGAFFQLLMLYGDLEEGLPWLSDKPGTARQLRRLRRLAASAAGWVGEQADEMTVAALRSYYLNPRFDEFTALEGYLRPAQLH